MIVKTAILYRTHFYNGIIEREYRRLRDQFTEADVFLMIDVSRGLPKGIPPDIKLFPFTNEDLKALGYVFVSIMYNCEFAALLFQRRQPQYDHYWLIDCDVRYRGNWREFLGPFSTMDGYDLLATHVTNAIENPKWAHWGESNVKFKEEIGVFYSVVRFSDRALRFLDGQYREGRAGFVELIGSSLLHSAGFKVGDFSGLAHRTPDFVQRAFYTPKSFRWRPIQLWPWGNFGLLVHPVKPILRYPRMIRGLVWEIWTYDLGRVRHGCKHYFRKALSKTKRALLGGKPQGATSRDSSRCRKKSA